MKQKKIASSAANKLFTGLLSSRLSDWAKLLQNELFFRHKVPRVQDDLVSVVCGGVSVALAILTEAPPEQTNRLDILYLLWASIFCAPQKNGMKMKATSHRSLTHIDTHYPKRSTFGLIMCIRWINELYSAALLFLPFFWSAKMTDAWHCKFWWHQDVRQWFGVVAMADKLRRARLRWFEHVLRADGDTSAKVAST